MSDFKQIWIFLEGFHRHSQYQISQKSVLWDLQGSIHTEGWILRR